MSDAEIRNFKLVELYHRYVGEPESKRDVYGYWLFLLGSVAGLAGVVVYQVEQALFPGDLAVREVAILLAAVGLAIALLGIVVLLPVRRRGMQASVVGFVVAAAGIAAFYWAYPDAWYVSPDYSAEIIAVYTAGIAIIVGVVVLVPIVTGEKGLLVEPEIGIGSDEPPILLGEVSEDAFFSVYQTPSKDWTWRTIRRDAIGESAQLAATDTDARLLVEEVREKIGSAGLLEITTAAFRLYRTEDDNWRWSLVREDGGVVATSDRPSSDRDEIESAVTFLKEQIPEANLVQIRGAAFDVYEDDGGQWRWRLVDDQREPLAASADGYPDRMAADGGTDTFIERLRDLRVLALESIGIELFTDDEDAWRWRVVDADDGRLATSTGTFETRRAAETAATDITDRLADATVIDHGHPGYEVYTMGDAWRWRLRDDADDLIATNYADAASEAAAHRSAERTRQTVADADVITFDGADYEVYPADDAWHWRLVAADRTVLAASTEHHEDRDAADAAADRVREQALAADLIEFEKAAFQQYESDGEWRWRLIDEDGRVMADSGEEYASKEAVREGMLTLKENAPDADVLEIETAAFEIYRTDGDDYAWRLIDETGQLIAEGADSHPSRATARDAVDFLLAHLDAADVRTMEQAVFQLYTDDESWGFWLVDTDGTILAEGTDVYPTRDDTTSAIEAVRAAGADGPVDTVGPVTVQVRDGGGWHWRLIDRDREPIATGERTYETREETMDDVTLVTENAADAPLFDIGRGIIWVSEDEDGWRWRLVDADRTELAQGHGPYESQQAVLDAIETVRARAPEAGTLDIDTLAFEVKRADDGWQWRLIDEDETVLGVSSVAYPSQSDLTEAIEEARETVLEASILEIDEVAFEFYERDGGWVWRLLDENGTPLAESVETHDTRQSAREEMLAVKEYAPDGETVVAW